MGNTLRIFDFVEISTLMYFYNGQHLSCITALDFAVYLCPTKYIRVLMLLKTLLIYSKYRCLFSYIKIKLHLNYNFFRCLLVEFLLFVLREEATDSQMTQKKRNNDSKSSKILWTI